MGKLTRKTIKRATNSFGVTYALVSDGVTWEVWKLCENYSARAPGGIAKQWRFIEKNMTEDHALELFERRTQC